MESKHSSRYLIDFLFIFRRFLLLVLTIGLTCSNVFSDTLFSNIASKNNEVSYHGNKDIANPFTMLMYRDPCNKKKAYNAKAQYGGELRVYIQPVAKDQYILSLVFKGNTYKVDVREQVKDALDILHQELDIKYKFVENYQDANVFVLTVAWPKVAMEGKVLGMSYPKGIPNPMVELYLNVFNIYLKSGLFLSPDVAYFNQVLKEIALQYDSDMEKGDISKKTTPEAYFKALMRYDFTHELEHVIGFTHPHYRDYPTLNDNKHIDDKIKIRDKKKYDNQPPLMVPSFQYFIGLYKVWKNIPLISANAVSLSLQEIETFKSAQSSSGSGMKYKAFSEPQCHNLQIMFDSD